MSGGIREAIRALRGYALGMRREAHIRFVSVSIDGHTVDFAVDSRSADPIQMLLGDGGFPYDPVHELFLRLVKKKGTIVDVGAHVGTYSLPAAATGATVIAVEASPANAALLRSAARRNSFRNLHVICAAAGSRRGSVRFTAFGPWGHVASASECTDGQTYVEVEARALDDVVSAYSPEGVAVIKIDVEGYEVEALEGLRETLKRDDSPPLLIEANGHMLHEYGLAPSHVIAALERYGYKCHQIDTQPNSRRLVEVTSGDQQWDCVADYLAFKAAPEALAPWSIVKGFGREEIVERVLATCQHVDLPHRRYGARLLKKAPPWLLEDASVIEAITMLQRES